MDNSTRLIIFRAQTRNVQKLKSARKQVERNINLSLRQGNTVSAEMHTKVLVLVFCAWVEASFSKIIHTPYGFTPSEIGQIKQEYSSNVGAGWRKCLEVGLGRISNSPRSNYIPNIRKKVETLISQYVVDPSLLRNKIAHGQWEVALNRENTAINRELSDELDNLDVIQVTKWFDVNERLLLLIEALIESPHRAFHRDYWMLIAELDEYLDKTKDWTLAQKIESLKQKPPRK